MRVPLKSVSEVGLQFQAIWSCYMQSLFITFLRKSWKLEQNAWIRNPFQEDIAEVILLAADEAQVIDLSCAENPKGVLGEQFFYCIGLMLQQFIPNFLTLLCRQCRCHFQSHTCVRQDFQN